MEENELIVLTADIVAAHVSNNHVAINDLPALVQQVHASLERLRPNAGASEPEKTKPAVSVRSSVKPDYLVCLVCGRKQRTIKRHLAVAHSMSPEDYRVEFDLPRDYPVVAPNYSRARSDMAQKIGLGRRRSEVRTPEVEVKGEPALDGASESSTD